MAVLMAVWIEISCDSLQEIAEGISISLLQSIRVQSIATSCKAENAPVNRRVVGSSPTSLTTSPFPRTSPLPDGRQSRNNPVDRRSELDVIVPAKSISGMCDDSSNQIDLFKKQANIISGAANSDRRL